MEPDDAPIAYDALLALQLRGRMSQKAVLHQLNLACFLTSNARKYDACSNWSLAAAERRREWKRLEPWPVNHGLIHEHIVPRKVIRDALYALPPEATLGIVHELLGLSENCIVTGRDDATLSASRLRQAMPAGWVLGGDKWARYGAVPRFPGSHPWDGYDDEPKQD